MIKQLYLRNFRRFESLNLDFTSGVNGVFGPNYRGKSTVLLAIAVALAGPAWARGRNLVRRGEKSFEIQLLLELNGTEYRVMRSKSGASLHRGDELIANQQTNVNIELGKLLGMSPARWLELRYIQQKEASAMFEAGAAKLNTLVEELSGVRTISHVIDRLTDRIRTTTARADVLREKVVDAEGIQELEEGVKTVTLQLESNRAETAKVLKQAGELEDSLEMLEQSRVQASHAHQLLQSQATRHAHLSQNLSKAAERLTSAEKPSHSPAQLEQEVREMQDNLAECSDWVTTWRNLTSNQSRDQQRVAAAKAAMPEMPMDPVSVEELEKKLKDLDGQEATLAQQQVTAQVTEKDLRSKVKSLAEAIESGICRGCNRPFDDHVDIEEERNKLATLETLHKGAKAELEKLTADLKEVRRQHDKLSAEVREAKAIAAKMESAEQRLRDAQADADQSQAALDEHCELIDMPADKFVEEVNKLAEELEEARQRLSRLIKQQAAYDQAHQSYVEAESALQEWEKLGHDLSELDNLAKAAEQAQEAVNTCRQAISSATSKLPLLQQQEGTLASNLEHFQRRLQDAFNVNEEADVTFRQLKELEGLRKYLRDNRSRYLQAAWDIMLSRASMFASTVTENHITSLTRTDAGEFEFEEQGEMAAVADASGAQAAILGMAVQTALAEVLPTPLDLLLADEPAADMDADHSGAAMMALSTLTKQAVVISHHRMDESLCAKVIEL